MPFQQKLLDWFAKHQRPLPWRRHYKPYEVWVSEIMLQQTQVHTALPYFDRWMRAFPTIESLAAASEEKVLKHWQGLGYYSRARNIHAGAKLILQDYAGQFPSDFEAILKLKGIGRYTAGAIASIAFNKEYPIVDGNVFRVLARLYAIKDNIDIPKNKEKFWALQESLIPKGQARFFNQALMELGALICTSNNPKCSLCPVQKFCKAFEAKNMEDYPVRSARKKTVKVQASALILKKDGRILIHRRPVGEVMGGLWEFPEWKISTSTFLKEKGLRAKTSRLILEDFGLETPRLKLLKTIKRSYTHHQETLHVFESDLAGGKFKPLKKWPLEWVTQKEFKNYPFSSAHSKIAHFISV